MEPIYLYTENYLFIPKIKRIIKKVLGRNLRGPQAVEGSLISGLSELGQPFILNQKFAAKNTACVLSGVETLREVIKWKEEGMVNKIVAGPNLVVTPEDFNGVIQHPAIDVVIQPSQWSADFYVSLAPALRNKLRVWPAGVAVPGLAKLPKTIDFLIYNKIGEDNLVFRIKDFLTKNNHSFLLFSYGKFKQEDYFSALDKTQNLIYISESESQGLAMFEAWARGVPALVWDRGFWRSGNYFWKAQTASPYVTSENGMVFKDFKEFKNILNKFIFSDFSPRKYILENFTNKFCAEKYLKVVKELEK